jgi:hypothetical protein
MNREEIEIELAERVVEGMDMDTLVVYATERLREAYRELSEEELMLEVQEFAPDLIVTEDEALIAEYEEREHARDLENFDPITHIEAQERTGEFK